MPKKSSIWVGMAKHTMGWYQPVFCQSFNDFTQLLWGWNDHFAKGSNNLWMITSGPRWWLFSHFLSKLLMYVFKVIQVMLRSDTVLPHHISGIKVVQVPLQKKHQNSWDRGRSSSDQHIPTICLTIPGLVNVYIANWKIIMLLMGKSTINVKLPVGIFHCIPNCVPLHPIKVCLVRCCHLRYLLPAGTVAHLGAFNRAHPDVLKPLLGSWIRINYPLVI